MLTEATICDRISPKLYTILLDSGIFMLPSRKHLRKDMSKFKDGEGLTEVGMEYFKMK